MPWAGLTVSWDDPGASGMGRHDEGCTCSMGNRKRVAWDLQDEYVGARLRERRGCTCATGWTTIGSSSTVYTAKYTLQPPHRSVGQVRHQRGCCAKDGQTLVTSFVC